MSKKPTALPRRTRRIAVRPTAAPELNDIDEMMDIDDIDDIVGITDDEADDEASTPSKPNSWTLISALEYVLSHARDSRLSDKFWKCVAEPIDYLRTRASLSPIQSVILAMLIEEGTPMSWHMFARQLGRTRMSLMNYSDEMEQLNKRRWLIHRTAGEHGRRWDGFALVPGLITTLRHNEVFTPEPIDNLSEQQFVEKISMAISQEMDQNDTDSQNINDIVEMFLEANPQLTISQWCAKLDDKLARNFLMIVLADHNSFAGSSQVGVNLEMIGDAFPFGCGTHRMKADLQNERHFLMREGYLEHKCEGGISVPFVYVLGSKTLNELLPGYTPACAANNAPRFEDRSLHSHEEIREKTLYFNPAEQEQVDRLTRMLSTDHLPEIQKRLQDEGMRKGFACLFYGAPGTGKTETVLQIARQTGRDIMQIDIAGMRDKYVGESEKNIKAVFNRYRKACKELSTMPILFFNEADGIFGKRSTAETINPSVTKMDNAMQNIILQEMEDLDGILIATTNLTCNLDPAFERRFLFKICFNNPSVEVSTHIWKSMLKDLSDDDARALATHFSFSGGQIENIARKRTIDYILSGRVATLQDLQDFCIAESLVNQGKARPVIGFA